MRRKQIREALVSVIAAEYAGAVFTVPQPDLTELSECITVSFDSGEERSEGLGSETEAQLVVSFKRAHVAGQDDLDDWADEITPLITASAMPSDVHYLEQEGWAYGTDETGQFSTLDINYLIIYDHS